MRAGAVPQKAMFRVVWNVLIRGMDGCICHLARSRRAPPTLATRSRWLISNKYQLIAIVIIR